MTALIHNLLKNPLDGPAIENLSMATIDREAPAHSFNAEEWIVVKRMIHTCADFALMQDIRFSSDAIDSAVAALNTGAPIFADSNMIRSGLSQARLRALNPGYSADSISCYVADPEVAAQAKATHLPRSLFAVQKAKPNLHGGIAIFGNAPVALLELNRMILEEGIRPALIIGMPVGFVHVIESKAEMMALDIPWIAIEGRRGGSTLAVATLHALCQIAEARR